MRFILAIVCLAACISSTRGQNRVSVTLQTTADIAARRAAISNEVVHVLGYTTAGDWGPPKAFRWDPTNTLTANAIRRQSAYTATGRWVHDWDGDVKAFGAKGDGVSDDTDVIQACLDYAGSISKTHTGSVDGGDFATVVLPQGTTYLISDTLVVPYGVNLVAAHGVSASKGFPEDRSAPRFVLAANTHKPMMLLGTYVSGGVTNRSRFSTLQGFVLDGNAANQNADWLDNFGILINDPQSKNFVFSGLKIGHTVGYGLFCRDGIGSSQIDDCYFGSGVFLGDGADIKMSNIDFTGRLYGTNSGTPFPVLWTTRFGWQNEFVNGMFFAGPRPDPGYHNSVRFWEVSSYDDVANTITLSSTNGLFDGIPLHWDTDAGTNAVTGLDAAEVYYALWDGLSTTIQIASTATWPTRTAVDFGAGSITNDAFVLGDRGAPLMLLSGGSSASLNRFVNMRWQDSAGDLVTIRGPDNNMFIGFSMDFSYQTNSRFLRLKAGANGNLFSAGQIAWRTATAAGFSAPTVLVEIDDTSGGNSFRNVYILGASGTNIIDGYTGVPANSFDTLAQSEWLTIRGENPSIWWEDVDVTNKTVWTLSNKNWFVAYDVAQANESNYQYRVNGLNESTELRGESQPRHIVSGYSAVPSVVLRRTGGDIGSPTETPAGGTIGQIEFSGHVDGAFTSARALVAGINPGSNWTTNNNETELVFYTTPSGSTERREVFRIESDGNITQTANAPILDFVPTNNVSGARIRVPAGQSTNDVLRVLRGNTTMFRVDQPGSTNFGVSAWYDGSLRRVYVGPTNSGPGGSGRALYID